MTDKQCSSCGGFCGRAGCKRENVKPNDFAPDWDAMAVMVEEHQRMAKRIEELEAMVKAEREACAKVAENGLIGHTIAQAIRARG